MGILRRLREWREDKDGTLIGPNIEADSLSTEKLYNDEEPNVDRSDPFWLTHTDTLFEDITAFGGGQIRTFSSGSGNTDASDRYFAANTGTTQGSEARGVFRQQFDFFDWTFGKRSSIRSRLRGSDTEDGERYIVRGSVGSRMYGFKLVGDELFGVVNDGGGEATTSLAAGVTPGSDLITLRADHYPGDRVEYYDNDGFLGEQSTSLSSGGDKTVFELSAANPNSQTDLSLITSRVRVVQGP